jgi:hypothetical protein
MESMEMEEFNPTALERIVQATINQVILRHGHASIHHRTPQHGVPWSMSTATKATNATRNSIELESKAATATINHTATKTSIDQMATNALNGIGHGVGSMVNGNRNQRPMVTIFGWNRNIIWT